MYEWLLWPSVASSLDICLLLFFISNNLLSDAHCKINEKWYEFSNENVEQMDMSSVSAEGHVSLLHN